VLLLPPEHPSKIKSPKNVELWQSISLQPDLLSKSCKTKRCSLYLSDSRFVTFDLRFEVEIGVPTEAVLACTLGFGSGTVVKLDVKGHWLFCRLQIELSDEIYRGVPATTWLVGKQGLSVSTLGIGKHVCLHLQLNAMLLELILSLEIEGGHCG
jgi:hypothetical protein